MATFDALLSNRPIVFLVLLLLATMIVSAAIGFFVRRRLDRASETEKDGGREAEGYVISAVLGLLALLLGFTFALAVDRFETRRTLVLQEANAIGTSYLRAQALAEPHRSRLSRILVEYTDNRIALASARDDRIPPLLANNDRLVAQLWAATLAANDAVKSTPFSSSLLMTVNEVIDLDAARKAARRARVPFEVFGVLWVYLAVTAGILGYARPSAKGHVLTGVLFVLLAMSYMLILDIDRPSRGGIGEEQGPMLELRDMMKAQPPGTFDLWRTKASIQ